MVNRRLIYILLAVLGVSVIAIGAIAARTALIAEENFQAFWHANRATLEYVQQNDGRWPTSWDDLREIRPESDFVWVAEHLTFDFTADPRKIAAQTPGTFAATKPNEPCYVIDDLFKS